MSGKVCRETRLEIDQSELRQPLSAEAEAHAATCAGCAAFRDERFRLRELVGALEPVFAPADFDVRDTAVPVVSKIGHLTEELKLDTARFEHFV